jgi:uncharacterized membrane protein
MHTDSVSNPSRSLTNNLLNFTNTSYSTSFFKKFLLEFTSIVNLNATNDGKNNNNPFLGYQDKASRKKVISLKKPSHFSVYDDLTESNQHNFYT